jgi:maltose alpha-D-glucosyltransferase/alpha-amylase
VRDETPSAVLTLVRVEYIDADAETYSLPLTYASGSSAAEVLRDLPHAVLARVRFQEGEEEGILYDAAFYGGFGESLLVGMARHRRRPGREGELAAWRTQEFTRIRGSGEERLSAAVIKGEQSNTSLVFGERLILKLFRRLQPGLNPDLEIGRFLTERGFAHIAPVAGGVEYYREKEQPVSLAILNGFVPNQGDAWQYTLNALSHYFEQVLARGMKETVSSLPPRPLLELADQEIPPQAAEMIGPYLESARLLGQRTGEMHVFLASDSRDPRFSPEPFSKLYQRSLYQSARSLTREVFRLLSRQEKGLSEETRAEALKVFELESRILDRFRSIVDKRITAMRIRCHGDYHLGQVLYTGKDFVIIDFEGETARPLSERRIKRSPLHDVSGMLRSFHYASYSALLSQRDKGLIRPEDFPTLECSAQVWRMWVYAAFLRAYLQTTSSGNFLPQDRGEFQELLNVYLLEKAVYELGYELNNRPEWVMIPLTGIQQLIRA